MKKCHIFSVVFVFLVVSFQLQAQDSIPAEIGEETILYTIGLNKVPDQCNVPLVGIVNVAKGNHKGLQLGFANTTRANFKGLAVGFANTVGESSSGSQIGFFNTVGNSSKGLDVGFFNTIGNSANGAQIGFFNTLGNSFQGLHVGFFNTLGNSANGLQAGVFNTLGNSFRGLQIGFFNTLGNEMNGFQIGFVNITGNTIKGLQVGFVNTPGNKVEGLQIGFINRTRNLSGVQLGFINLVDKVEKGLPIGFLSFVGKGGYQALEIGTTEMFPVNIAYKTGIERFYTSLVASYGPESASHFAFGLGIGALLSLNEKLSFNPEIISQTNINSDWDQIYSLHLNLHYKVSEKYSIVAGPTLVWNHLNSETDFHEPVFSLYQTDFNSTNRLLIGLHAAVRYRLGK